MNMCQAWWDEAGFNLNTKNIILFSEAARLSCLVKQPAYLDILFHINTQLKSKIAP